LILGSNVVITPRVQVFGQLVKIALMDHSKVQNGVEPVLVQGDLGRIIKPNVGESGTEGNGMSNGGHDEQRKGKKSWKNQESEMSLREMHSHVTLNADETTAT
jgi:hypothetical protein